MKHEKPLKITQAIFTTCTKRIKLKISHRSEHRIKQLFDGLAFTGSADLKGWQILLDQVMLVGSGMGGGSTCETLMSCQLFRVLPQHCGAALRVDTPYCSWEWREQIAIDFVIKSSHYRVPIINFSLISLFLTTPKTKIKIKVLMRT